MTLLQKISYGMGMIGLALFVWKAGPVAAIGLTLVIWANNIDQRAQLEKRS
jgi:hypothetical protein